MQENVIKLRGNYELKVQVNGDQVTLEVFSSDGQKVDYRRFTHRDLTGEESLFDVSRGYNERGW